MTNSKDIKDIKDKLSWDKIRQLHEAVSNFSKQSFDIKKLWITVEVSAITLMLTLKMNDVRFIICVSTSILVFFFLLDSMTYYYQDKLRQLMANEQNAIRERSGLKKEKVPRTKYRIIRSLINWSHLLYYGVGAILFACYKLC